MGSNEYTSDPVVRRVLETRVGSDGDRRTYWDKIRPDSSSSSASSVSSLLWHPKLVLIFWYVYRIISDPPRDPVSLMLLVSTTQRSKGKPQTPLEVVIFRSRHLIFSIIQENKTHTLYKVRRFSDLFWYCLNTWVVSRILICKTFMFTSS